MNSEDRNYLVRMHEYSEEKIDELVSTFVKWSLGVSVAIATAIVTIGREVGYLYVLAFSVILLFSSLLSIIASHFRSRCAADIALERSDVNYARSVNKKTWVLTLRAVLFLAFGLFFLLVFLFLNMYVPTTTP